MEFKIKTYPFDTNGKNKLEETPKGKDWPVVYLIHNDKELYVGETSNAVGRFNQHLSNPQRKKLKEIEIIFDDEFNKSAILDIEQSLIQLFNADNKFKLQNLNGGQSQKHNYYQREKYLNKLNLIWDELSKMKLVDKSMVDIKNSDLFKYSPYNTLTAEQISVSNAILNDIIEKINNNADGTAIIRGGAGTGKTIVLINMIYKLANIDKFEVSFSEDDENLSEDNLLFHNLKKLYQKNGSLKVGYVVPMTSIRKTLKTVFNKTKNGLKASMVISPYDTVKDEYDVLFVDEAHRLTQYKNISNRGAFKTTANKLGLDEWTATQLDFIVKRSKYRVLVYDPDQTVKGSDITNEQFYGTLVDSSVNTYFLNTQMRCSGGKEYTEYLTNIFSCTQDEFLPIENYEFCLYDDVDLMVNDIKDLDNKYGLCRNAAGYSWKWISKGMKDYSEIIKQEKQDIIIGPYRYIWNMTNEEFIISENSVNQIGCIHTLQGYDLNYVGVILGEEIDYNPNTKRIEVDLNKFYDTYVKQGTEPKLVREYIINSYKVIMSRGIKGCYLYACNDNMRNYLKKFVKSRD